MARDLLIDIRARDSASPVFAKMGQAAKSATDEIDKGTEQAAQELTNLQTNVAKMEAAFEKHARESGQAMQDLKTDVKSVSDTVERSAAEMGKSFESAADRIENSVEDATRATKEAEKATVDYSRANSEMLKGLGLLGTAFTLYANQARDQERNIIAIERMYGEAADSYIRYANQIQNTSIFSDDQALEAIRIMSSLRGEYELTDAQIMQLVQTSADLASIYGYDLPDAAMRVQSSIRGETESIEQLGIALNATAIDQQGLMTTMSNAEAAQFRYQALMEQSSASMGAAAQVAETTSGKVQQLANEFQDAMLSVVRFTGPVGEAASGLAAFGLQGGIAATGLIQLGRGISTAAAAAGGFTAVMGPAGLIVLGLTAATTAGILLARAMRDDVAEAMKSARLEGEELDKTISALTGNLSGLDLKFASAIVGSDDPLDQLSHDIEYWSYLVEKWKYATGDAVEMMNTKPEWFAELDAETQDRIRNQALEQGYIDDYVEQYGSMEDAANALAEAERDLNSILTHRGAGREEILSQLEDLTKAYKEGDISISEYTSALDLLESQMYEIDNDVILDQLKAEEEAARQATIAQYDLLEARRANAYVPTTPLDTSGLWSGVDDYVAGVGLADASLRRLMARQNRDGLFNSEDIDAYVDEVRQVKKEYEDLDTTLETSDRSWRRLTDAIAENRQHLLDERQALATVQAAALDVVDAKQASIEASRDQAAAFDELMQKASGLSDALYQIKQLGGSTSIDVAVNTTGAQNALQGGFNAIVGGSNAMAQLAEQTWNWSNSLTEGAMGQSKLDQLMLDGKISAKTYGDALEANHRIMKANESVQEDVLRIQAKQLPVMAQLAEEHARYVDKVADMNVEQQTAALGFMDSSKSMQAMSVAQMIAASTTDHMKTSTSEMIEGMAAGDPVLRTMLEQMGLITVGADGTITVNYDDAITAEELLGTLNETLNDLLTLLEHVFLVDVNIDDSATPIIDQIKNSLLDLDGTTSTVYVNTVGGGLTLGTDGSAATGRTFVSKYAVGGTHGGSYALVGEHGPELTWLPNGAQVTNAAASKGAIDRMGAGKGGDIIYNAPVVQNITLDNSSFARRQTSFAGYRRSGG